MLNPENRGLHSAHTTGLATTVEYKSYLAKLHQSLLAEEHAHNNLHIADEGCNEGRTSSRQLFSRIQERARTFQHYDCFSFCNAVAASFGLDVPTLPLEGGIAIAPPSESITFCRQITQQLEQCAELHPSDYFRFMLHQEVMHKQSSAFDPKKSISGDVVGRLLFLKESNYLIHGMIVLGPTADHTDYWIMHRNHPGVEPRCAPLSNIKHFWETELTRQNQERAECGRGGGATQVKLTCALAPDYSETLPKHPEEILIERTLALREELAEKGLRMQQWPPLYRERRQYARNLADFALAHGVINEKHHEFLIELTSISRTCEK